MEASETTAVVDRQLDHPETGEVPKVATVALEDSGVLRALDDEPTFPWAREYVSHVGKLAEDVTLTAREMARLIVDGSSRERLRKVRQVRARDAHGKLDVNEQLRSFVVYAEYGKRFEGAYVLRDGDPDRPVVFAEHGLGGTRREFDLLKDTVPDLAFAARNRYPSKNAPRPERAAEFEVIFARDLWKLSGGVRDLDRDVVAVGHSFGTVYWRMLAEASHEIPPLIGLRDGDDVSERLRGMVLINPPELDNVVKRSPFDLVPGLTPVALRGAIDLTNRIEDIAEAVTDHLPKPVRKPLHTLNADWIINAAITAPIVSGRLGRPEHVDQAAYRRTVVDAMGNRLQSVHDELGILMHGDEIFAMPEEEADGMPPTVVLTCDQDALVSRVSSYRTYRQLRQRYGADKVVYIEVAGGDHGIPWDARFASLLSELTQRMADDAAGFVRELTRQSPRGYRYILNS